MIHSNSCVAWTVALSSVILSIGSFLLFILWVELSNSSCVAVTQSLYNVLSSIRSIHYTFLSPFEPLTTHSFYHIVWDVFLNSFLNILSVGLSHFSGVTVKQGSCNFFPLSQSGHSTLILSFEQLLTHPHNYRVWTATRFFCLCFTHFLNETVPLFLSNCYTRSLKYFLIVFKWTLHFTVSLWVIGDPFS